MLLEQSHIFGCVSTLFSAKRLLGAKLVSLLLLRSHFLASLP